MEESPSNIQNISDKEGSDEMQNIQSPSPQKVQQLSQQQQNIQQLSQQQLSQQQQNIQSPSPQKVQQLSQQQQNIQFQPRQQQNIQSQQQQLSPRKVQNIQFQPRQPISRYPPSQFSQQRINTESLSTEVISPLVEIHTELSDRGDTNLSQDEFIQQILKKMGNYGYTPDNIGSNMNDYAKKQIMSSLIITALGSMGIATGPIAPFVKAAVMKPGSTAKLAVAGTLIGAPLSFSFPFVAIFSILWVFLFISLIIHWIVRSNTKSNTKIFWDPENDKDAHKNFTKFMLKSGIFLIIYYGITALYLKFAFDQSMDILLGD